MRIIAGEYRGRRLAAPEGRDIRPTTDKTREALFSILMNEVPGARVLDVFAGTGALGIEALSRGASGCTFVDQSRMAIRLIKENLSACGETALERSRVLAGDFRRVLASLEGPFDIILMDPPYRQGLWEDAFEIIAQNDLLAPGGTLVCEHRKEEELPDEIAGFTREKERRYGISKLSIYRCYGPDDMVI
ncbi:MAG: 16S rRNA (guanine(966)-N(2))-methyltransferase RsmD [Firmicutes bacterium]|nr:16S rRNA (guanine(966)-N(2))-methyltransferase RsmD [Bacillota bacterium]